MKEYTTQMDAARKGLITPQMKKVASKEHIAEEQRENGQQNSCEEL